MGAYFLINLAKKYINLRLTTDFPNILALDYLFSVFFPEKSGANSSVPRKAEKVLKYCLASRTANVSMIRSNSWVIAYIMYHRTLRLPC